MTEQQAMAALHHPGWLSLGAPPTMDATLAERGDFTRRQVVNRPARGWYSPPRKVRRHEP